MEYNFDNINEFFEDLIKKPNAKFNMLRVYGAYERECEKVKQEREIRERYKLDRADVEIYTVNDNITIVARRYRDGEVGYFACVNGKRSSYIWPTFEQALLCAVSIKMTGHEDAAEWMWKLLKE